MSDSNQLDETPSAVFRRRGKQVPLAGSSSSDIRSTGDVHDHGKTRVIEGEERAFLSTETLTPTGATLHWVGDDAL